MTTITQYIQAPSKLQSVLSYCVELNDDAKHKVCVIEDIARMRRLLGMPPMSSAAFDAHYNADILHLETLAYALQIAVNTHMYEQRVKNGNEPLQGADF